MAIQEAINTAKDTVKDTVKETSRDARDTLNSSLKEVKDIKNDIKGSGRLNTSFEQISNTTQELYSKANDWLAQGSNRTYSTVALVATAGLAGFLLGRMLSGPSAEAEVRE